MNTVIDLKINNILEYMATPEYAAISKKYFDDLQNKRKIQDSQIDRFWNKYRNDLDSIIEKIITKYSSIKYRESWYKRHIEPTEELYFFLHSVAEKYGREFSEEEYAAKENTMFTADVYVLGNWTIELIIGQGSAILINKIK